MTQQPNQQVLKFNREIKLQSFESTQLQALLVTVLTLIAGILRFYKLGVWSLWVEEYHTIAHTEAIDSIKSAFLSIRPVFYLLEKPIFAVFGVNEWNARLVPTLIGIATIPLFFWAAKKLFSLWIALLATFLLTVSPWHLYWSQNARFYTLFLLLFNLSMFSFYWGVEQNRFRWILVSLAAMALAILTHGLGVILLVLFLVYFFGMKLLPFEKPAGLRFRYLLPFILLPILGYLFLEVYIFLFTDNPPFYTIMSSEFSKASGSSWIGYSSPLVMLTASAYYLGAPLFLLSLTGALFMLKERQRSGFLLIVSAIVPLGLMMIFTLFASTVNRYVFMTLPSWIFLAAVAVHRLFKYSQGRLSLWFLILGFLLIFIFWDPAIEDLRYYWMAKPTFRLTVILAFTTVLALVILFSQLFTSRESPPGLVWTVGILLVLLVHPLLVDSMYFAYQNGHRDNLKSAVQTIQDEKNEGDLVVAAIPPLVNYYLDEPLKGFEEVELEDILQAGRIVWFIEDNEIEDVSDDTFQSWAQNNCEQVENLDTYTAGRVWVMRVERCKLSS